MTVEIKITRKVQSYRRGINGIGTVDWEVELECGHIVAITEADLLDHPFRTEMTCNQCIQYFDREANMFKVAMPV